jgi:hypothetical protein
VVNDFPPFEFVEIPPADMREYFHDEVIARGCPSLAT